MALLVPQQMTIGGVAQTLTQAVASDTMPPGDRLFLWVKTTGTATTVTVPSPPGLDRFGLTMPDLTCVCPATGDRLLGPLDASFADATTRLITANFSGALTGVTRALVTM